jgi:hypothetical protein
MDSTDKMDSNEARRDALNQAADLPPHVIELQANIQALDKALSKLDDELERGNIDHGRYMRKKVDLEGQKTVKQAELANAMRHSPLSTSHSPLATSPFFFGRPIPDDARFYGRRDETKTILERLAQRNSTSIVGERRIGKSSLLLHVQRQLPAAWPGDARPIPIYLDLMKPSAHTRQGVMRAIRGRLERAGVKAGWSKEEDGDLLALDEALEGWASAGLYPILLLDEVDKLTERVDEFDDLLEAWRAAGGMGQLGFVTASLRPLADLCQASGCSPFYNIFQQVELGLLRGPDWRALVQDGFSSRLPLEPPDLAWIDETAGGHPFYTQIAAHLLHQARSAGEDTTYAALSDRFAAEVDTYFADLWRCLDRPARAALKHLSGDAQTLRPNKRALNALRRRGLVLQDERPFSAVWARGIREGWWDE